MAKPLRIVLIVLFVVADVALGAAAWKHVHREPAPSDIDVAALTAAPSDSAGAAKPYELEPADVVMVDATADGTVITARRGACDGEAPVVRVSTNGGRTLTAVDPGVSEVLAVRVDEESSALTVIGADKNCKVGATRSTDDGRTWKDVSVATADGWYPGTGDLAEVVTPDGTSKPGCKVSSLSAIDDTFARVSCTDGRIRGTGDAGKTWTTLGTLTNLRAASFDDYTNGTALARHEGCADYAFTTADGGRTWKPRGCVGGEAAQALSSDGTRLVAMVDDQVAVSANRGTTWTIHESATPSLTATTTATASESPRASESPTPSSSPTR